MEGTSFFAGPLLDFFPELRADFKSNGIINKSEKVNTNLIKLIYFFNNQLREIILSNNEGCVIYRYNEA